MNLHRPGRGPSQSIEDLFNATMHMGLKRDQFIHDLDQLLRSNEPGSLDKALRLAAECFEISPEDLVAECCSRPLGSLRKELGQLVATGIST